MALPPMQLSYDSLPPMTPDTDQAKMPQSKTNPYAGIPSMTDTIHEGAIAPQRPKGPSLLAAAENMNGRQYWGNSCGHAVNDAAGTVGLDLKHMVKEGNADWVPNYANAGHQIQKMEDMLPGDIVLYKDKLGPYAHVGVYSGNGNAWNVSSSHGHKWTNTPIGDAFQEGRRLDSTPKGPDEMQQMPSGRNRKVAAVNDLIEAHAAKNGIDRPEILKDQFQQESNYRNGVEAAKRITSESGAVGIPQFMPTTLAPLLQKHGWTVKDYMNSENVQVALGAEYMGQKLKQYGNYPQALAAYNAGDGKLSDFTSRGKALPTETVNYVQKILHLDSPQAAIYAIQNGKTPDGKIGAWKPQEAAINSPTSSVLSQMTRNMIPWMANEKGEVFGYKTENDAPWAASKAADVMNQFTMGLSGLWARPDQDYEKWKSNNLHPIFNFASDNAISLPVMALFSELAAPVINAPGSWIASKLGMAGEMLGTKALAEGLMEARQAGKLGGMTSKMVDLLTSIHGELPEAMKWMTTLGVYHMNEELGRQFEQGSTFKEAAPGAMMAGLHGAISSLRWLIGVPLGLSALAGVGKLGASLAGELGTGMMKALETGKVEGLEGVLGGGVMSRGLEKYGHGIAQVAGDAWNSPSFAPVRDKLVAAGQAAWKTMDAFHQMSAEKGVMRARELMSNLGENFRILRSRSDSASTNFAAADQVDSRIADQHKMADTAEQKFNQSQQAMQQAVNGLRDFEKQNPVVSAVAGHEAVIKNLESKIETSQKKIDGFNEQLKNVKSPKDSKVAWTNSAIKTEQANIKTTENAISGVNNQISQLSADKVNAPIIQQYAKMKNDLQPIADEFGAASKDPNYLRRDEIRKFADSQKVYSQSLRAMAEKVSQSVKDYQTTKTMDPFDLSRTTTLDPFLPGGTSKNAKAAYEAWHDLYKNQVEDSINGFKKLLPDETVGQVNRSMWDQPSAEKNIQMMNDLHARIKKQGGDPDYMKGLSSMMGGLEAVPPGAKVKQILNMLGPNPSQQMLKDFQAKSGGNLLSLADKGRVDQMMGTPAVPAVTSMKSLTDAAYSFMSHNFTPALLQLNRNMALLSEFAHGETLHNDLAGQMDKMLSDRANHKVAFENQQRGWLKARQAPTIDDIFGFTAAGGRDAMTIHADGERMATWAGQYVKERLDPAMKAHPSWKGWTAEQRAEYSDNLYHALTDATQMRKLLEENPKIAEPLHAYFTFQAARERFLRSSPEMSGWVIQDYARRIFPRIQEYSKFMNAFNDVDKSASMEKLSGWLGTEQRRRIDDLPGALADGKLAQQRLQEKGLTWTEYVKLGNNIARGKRMGIMPEDAEKLLHEVLLGKVVTDIPALITEQMRSMSRADALRTMVTQLRGVTDGSTPGNLGLIHYVEKGEGAPNARVRQAGGEASKPYMPLDTIPGMGGYKIEQNGSWMPARDFLVHPESYSFLHDYLSFQDQGAVSKALTGVWNTLRGFELATSAVPHAANTFWNIMVAANFNPLKAIGMYREGGKIAADADLLGMAFRSGMQPKTYTNYIRVIQNDLLTTVKQAGTDEMLYGNDPKNQAMMAKVASSLSNNVIKPILRWPEFLLSGEKFLNSASMFKAISNAQLGGWAHWTARIWEKQGPQLIDEMMSKGMNTMEATEAAFLKAQQGASQIMNKAAGSIPSWWFSSVSRQIVNHAAAAPSLFMTKMRALAEGFDALTSRLGARSAFAGESSPTMRNILANQSRNFLFGSFMSGLVGAEVLNYFLNPNSGHSTFSNPDNTKYMHVYAGTTPSGDVYISPPFVGMFRWLAHGIVGSAKEKSITPMVQDLENQAHGMIRTLADVYRGYGSPQQFGSNKPLIPHQNITSPEAWGDWARVFYYDMFNTKAMPAFTSENPANRTTMIPGVSLTGTDEMGNPQSGSRMLMNLAGLNPTKSRPPWSSMSQKVREAYQTEDALLRNKVGVQIDRWLDAGGMQGTPESIKMMQNIADMAIIKGIPISNDEVRDYFKNAPTPGHYVLSQKQLQDMITARLQPAASASKGIPPIIQPLLHQKQLEAMKRRDEFLRGNK